MSEPTFIECLERELARTIRLKWALRLRTLLHLRRTGGSSDLDRRLLAKYRAERQRCLFPLDEVTEASFRGLKWQ